MTAEDFLRARLFAVSYAPLWLVFGVRSMPADLTLDPGGRVAIQSWFWFAAAAVSVIDGWRLTRGARAKGRTTQRFAAVRDQGAVVSGYLATYVLPLVGLDRAGDHDLAVYFIYFGVAFILFVKSDLALVNPTLYVLGWRVMSGRPALDPATAVEGGPLGQESLILCHRPTELESPVEVVRLAGCFVVVDPRD